MLENKPSYYDSTAKLLAQFLYEQYYAPLLLAIGDTNIRLNAKTTFLIRALQSGRIQYTGGKFTGSFNARISRELADFAHYDRRSHSWIGNPPADVKASAILAETKRKDITDRMNKAISDCESGISDVIKKAPFGDALPIDKMSDDIADDLKSIGVAPDLNRFTVKKLRKDYTNNQRLNIENWSSEQTSRLRKLVEEYQTTGTTGSLREMIQKEWGTTAAKAQFLARQETSLFFGTLSRTKAKKTGVRRYRWSTSHDEKVRTSHKLNDGQIVDIDSDGLVVDLKTGRKAHAGEDYGCRCGKIWILDEP